MQKKLFKININFEIVGNYKSHRNGCICCNFVTALFDYFDYELVFETIKNKH